MLLIPKCNCTINSR